MPPKFVSLLLLPGLAAVLAINAAAQNGPTPSRAAPSTAPVAAPGGAANKTQAAAPAKNRRAGTQAAAAAANQAGAPASQPSVHALPTPSRGKSSNKPAVQKAQPETQSGKPAVARPARTAGPRPAKAPPSQPAASAQESADGEQAGGGQLDFFSMLFVFMLATFIGLGVIMRVSRLLHTPLMSLTNAISAIAVVGSIVLAGGKHYPNNWYHFWGAVALFASMTNIVSGFLITDRMLKMFKTREGGK